MSIANTWMPRADIRETKDEYALQVALAGVRKEDIAIGMLGRVLMISGTRKPPTRPGEGKWLRLETPYGAFQRSFILPEGLHPEDVRAHVEFGVLTLTMRRPAEVMSKARRVSVD